MLTYRMGYMLTKTDLQAIDNLLVKRVDEAVTKLIHPGCGTDSTPKENVATTLPK